MKKIMLHELLFLIVLLFLISAVHADETLLPSSGIGFQGSESSQEEDHTSYIQDLDSNWAPPTTLVPNNYYATGLDANYWDALSVKFDTNEYDPSEYTAVLRFYAKKGSYWNGQWYHYIILKGEKNPKYQDADWEAVSNDPNVHSISNSGGSWFEEVLPSSYWNSGSFWVTLRMWNVKVDAVELVIIPKEPPSITVTSPNGGEVWLTETGHHITWTSSGNVGSTVKIEALKGGVVYRTIEPAAPNNGDFSLWIQGSGTDYKIRITSVTYPEITDTSDNSFAILMYDVFPVADFSGSPLSGGTPLDVEFTDQSTGLLITNWRWDFGDGVIVNYGTKTNPTHRYTNPGTYSVTLTVTNPVGPGTRTRPNYITVTSNPNEPPSITVTSPNGGEVWVGVATDHITWTSSGNVGSTVNIELLKGGVVYRTIDVVPNNGDYRWSHFCTASNNYKIRITSVTYPEITDTSDNFFTMLMDDAYPVADFYGTPLSGGAPLDVGFTDQSTGPLITNWRWDFGDGVIANYGTKTNPSHRYTDSGTYSVTLTVTNAVGSNTRTRPSYITVTSSPSTVTTTHIGIFRPSSGIWSLDSNGNNAWEGSDATLSWGLPGDTPVIGDWNGDGKDEIGIFRPGSGIWSLDSNGNNAWEGSDVTLSWGLPGDTPVIGDWNGDTKDDIGIFRPGSGIWSLDSNGNFAWEGSDATLSWGLPNDNPVIGDWNGDTKDDIGIFRPGSGIWSLDSNGNNAWEGSDVTLSWGLPNDKPVVGKY
jgi:PKD repeat protein